MNSDIFDKKLFLCCLGIVFITLLCYVIKEKLNENVKEGIPPFSMSDIIEIATIPMQVAGVASGLSNGMVSIAQGVMNSATTIATGGSEMATNTATGIWNYLKQAAAFAKTQATSMAIGSAGMAKSAFLSAEARAGQVAMAAKKEGKALVRDAKGLVEKSKTLRFIIKITRKVWPWLKWIMKFFFYFNLMQKWGFRVIDVLIYRIFHFKDCFLWYFLEIIGFILYIPLEFFVWLFCLQSSEKMFWKTVNDIDCMFFDTTGFHIFHYSDAILLKCYAKRFPPFPKGDLGFNEDGTFDEKQFIEFVLDLFMPPTPSEIVDGTTQAVNIMKDNGPMVAEATEEVLKEFLDSFVIKPHNNNELKDSVSSSTGDIMSF